MRFIIIVVTVIVTGLLTIGVARLFFWAAGVDYPSDIRELVLFLSFVIAFMVGGMAGSAIADEFAR